MIEFFKILAYICDIGELDGMLIGDAGYPICFIYTDG